MGSSPSVEDLKTKDTEFRQYLKTLEEDLGGKATDAETKLKGEIDAFYKQGGYDDAKPLISGQNTDFMHEKEFSLENMKNVIDGISAAVFSGAAPPKGAPTPNGDAVAAAGKAMGREVGALSNLELYIAGKVFDVLSSIVLSFGTGTSMTYTTATKSEPLGYGLQLFTSVSASSYESHGFFTNENIFEYLYMYRVLFSAQQAGTEVKMAIVENCENEAALKGELLNMYGEQLLNGKISLQQYDTTAALLHKGIEDLLAQINRLKSAAVTAKVKAVLERARAAS